eukprot:g11395.t1
MLWLLYKLDIDFDWSKSRPPMPDAMIIIIDRGVLKFKFRPSQESERLAPGFRWAARAFTRLEDSVPLTDHL